MIFRILLVEDSPHQLNDLERAFLHLSEAQKLSLRVQGVQIQKATSVAAAINHLTQAKIQNQSFDALLLDLSIPEGETGPDLPQHGIKVLEFARKHNTARLIIVASAYSDLDRSVAPAFRSGANDFVQKPYEPEEIVLRVISNWQRLVAEKKKRLLEQARQTLLFPFWKTIAYRFNLQVAQFLQRFSQETAEIQSELWRRFGTTTEHDHNSLSQRLRELMKTIEEARHNWEQDQDLFNYEEDLDNPQSLNLDTELHIITDELRPYIDVKLSLPRDPLSSVFSAGDDVQIVLREMLLGGLVEGAEIEQIWEIYIKVTQDKGVVTVSQTDNFPTLPLEIVMALNAGQTLTPVTGQWRAWGLSIARHLAFCGGGRLEIVPPPRDTDGIGNDINYFIPLRRTR